mgnify:CR=1 FL=1
MDGNKGNYGVSVKVWGSLACFTRPETKVERVSYPFPTPSAARGILEAIYWHPEMFYEIKKIRILNPIKYLSIMTNELKSKTSFVVGRRGAEGGARYYREDDRTQRHSLLLKDVAYEITARIVLNPHRGPDNPIGKYLDQFNRRVEKGKCYKQPYFGMRDFSCNFAPANGDRAVPVSQDFGLMLGELEYHSGVSTLADPVFIQGVVKDGVFTVPEDLYRGLKRFWRKENGEYVLAETH